MTLNIVFDCLLQTLYSFTAASQAPAFPLILPEPCGDSGGNGVRTHLLEKQRPGRRDTQCQFSCSSLCKGMGKIFMICFFISVCETMDIHLKFNETSVTRELLLEVL